MKRFLIILLFFLIVPIIAVEKNGKRNRVVDRRESGAQKTTEDELLLQKMHEAEQLVNDAVVFFNENSLGNALHAFEDDERWFHGEFDIDVFDSNGHCWLFGSEFTSLFVNFKDAKEVQETKGLSSRPLGIGVIEEMIREGDKGGGWVSFEWNFATCYSYVRTAIKDGRKYIIFSGIYPESPRFQIQQLVKSAIHYAQEHGAALTFQQINNPSGEFILGDGYLWAYDMEANNYAHGRNPALVGQNLINFQDSTGRFRNKIMIDLVKKQGSGWLEYDEQGVTKYTYVESFKDPRTGEQYIIGGGYYPRLADDDIVSFVKKAIEYLKAQGQTVALRDFSSYGGGFMKGPLRITVLNLEGKVLADAVNPFFIGQNILNIRDPEGKYVAREIIDKVKKFGKGWVTYVENRAYKSLYAELIETPEGKFIVTAGFWPSSKEHSTQALCEKAALHLELSPLVEALHDFTTYNTEYLKGDLFVEVYNEDGICFAYGWDQERVWNDEKKVFLDRKGYPNINKVLDTAKRGGGWTEYELYQAPRRVYTKMVTRPIPRLGQEKTNLSEKEELQTEKGVTRKEIKKVEKTTETFIVAVGYFI
jgi:cytochrome c